MAAKFLTDLEVDSEETRKAVASFIPAAFASVGAMAKQFYAAERRCGGWVGVGVAALEAGAAFMYCAACGVSTMRYQPLTSLCLPSPAGMCTLRPSPSWP